MQGMLERNWGRVIFIASESGVNIPADMIPYGVSKAAQIALARGLAETTAGSRLTVNSVLPGPTYSEGITKFLAELPLDKEQDRASLEHEFLVKLRPTSLIKRFATAQEVASLVTYIASPLSSATNGASLRVEGGLLRHPF
jgi:NAD(P)-dependent dehydrogenase (short-subunit alcohol dehydrogenase family)